MIRKKVTEKLAIIIVLVLLAGILSYFYISLNRMEKMTLNIQSSAASDSGKISAIVNLFNSNLNAQQ